MTGLTSRRLSRVVAMFMACILMSACSLSSNGSTSNDKFEMTDTTKTVADDITAVIHTTKGDVTVRLFGDTPAHQANFVKLAREGAYDGVLFHRVIRDFMVQTGDPDSKNASKGQMLGTGGPGYEIDAEILCPKYFHRRGALAAARQGDNVNPRRRSSGSQFYIVTGKKYNEQQLAQMEKAMQNQGVQAEFDSLVRKHRDEIMTLRRNRDQAGLQALQEKLVAEATAAAASSAPRMTDEMRTAYMTEGGTPHLDGAYTVFGQVIDGLDVVDSIQQAETDRNDRPNDDIRITGITIVGQ